jgi:hypothetical protein
MKSFLQFLPESFIAELSMAATDSVSPLGGNAEVPSARDLARTENELQIDDTVKITGNVNHHGARGKIVNFDSNKSFVVVQLNGKDYSFHTSDVTVYDDTEGDNDDDEEERELNNWRELAGIAHEQQ